MRNSIYLILVLLILSSCGTSTTDVDLSGTWNNGVFRKIEIVQKENAIKVRGDRVEDCLSASGTIYEEEIRPNGDYIYNEEKDQYEKERKGGHLIIKVVDENKILFFIEKKDSKQICETYYERNK